VFNNGYDPDFDWDKGGRLYSQGHGNYQQMPKEARLRMTINGEPVCEIDIRASYLTIFHAWNGAHLDPRQDPYQLPGLGPEARAVVKMWYVATFGNEAHLDKWPKEIAAEYRDRTGRPLSKDYPISRVREKALEAHPVLARWGEPIETWRMDCPQDHPALRRWRDGHRRMGWAELMYLESAAMWYAMQALKYRGIPSLSMHDSLIVPASKQDLAVDEIRKGYARVALTEPITLVVHHARTDSDENRSTVLYGDEDAAPQQGKLEELACPEEEDRTNPARWDEDSVGDSERTDNDHEVVREHPPYDPDKPWDF